MRIDVLLPPDRREAGSLRAIGDDGVILIDAPARGKADNGAAAKRGNPHREPVFPGGDFPDGTYRVVSVEWDKKPPRSYGSAFLLLDPVSGDAYLAKDNGREGLAIHGGDPAPDGSLRATEGCLRVSNETAAALGNLVEPELTAGTQVLLECKAPGGDSAVGETEGVLA